MAIEGIKKEDLLKKLREQQKIGMPQVQVNPNQGQDQGGQGIDPNSWSSKYGNSTVFDIKQQDVVAPRGQIAGAQAGSYTNPVNPNDNSVNQTFNLADAVQMDNLPVGGTNAIGGVQTVSPSAINQPTGTERGETDNAASGQSKGGKGSAGYDASHAGLMTSLSWTPGSTTVKVPNESASAGEATLTTTSEPNEAGEVNPEGAPNADENSDVNNDEKVNPNDSANKNVDNDETNPNNDNTDKADVKLKEKEAEEAARRKAEEEAAQRRAEDESA